MADNPDPVHQEDGKWYFWEETWAHRSGPFETEAIAREQMDNYAQFILGIQTAPAAPNDDDEPAATYKLIRHFNNGDREDLMTGQTFEQVRAHCGDDESSSRTCKSPNNIAVTAARGDWFDGFYRE